MLEVKRTSLEWNNDVQAKTFVTKKFPEEWPLGVQAALIGDMFNRFQFCPFPVLQSVVLMRSDMSRELSGVKSARKEQESKSMMRHFNPNLDNELKDWGEVNKELSSGAALCRLVMHTVLFEGIALASFVPLSVWITGHQPHLMLGLSIIMSVVAMLWNLVYNWGFDHLLSFKIE